jgi:hypothetical protein
VSRSTFRCIRAMKLRCTICHAREGPGFHKKRIRTHYNELVFFHLVGSGGHVVHSGAKHQCTIFHDQVRLV